MEIIFKRKTSLGRETYEELGFNSEEDLELEISKLTEFTPEFKNNLKKVVTSLESKGLIILKST